MKDMGGSKTEKTKCGEQETKEDNELEKDVKK
jgi:hypothetical protein